MILYQPSTCLRLTQLEVPLTRVFHAQGGGVLLAPDSKTGARYYKGRVAKLRAFVPYSRSDIQKSPCSTFPVSQGERAGSRRATRVIIASRV
jgi:hypothetical protein